MAFVFFTTIYAVILIFLAAFFLAFLLGAPYVRTKKGVRGQIYDFAGLKGKDVVLDLGSGDGVLLRILAARGARGIGWEVNPLLVAWSRLANLLLGYGKMIKIERKNMWKRRFVQTDAVILYAMPGMMEKLTKKMSTELCPGTKVISVRFRIPGLRLEKEGKDLFLYVL